MGKNYAINYCTNINPRDSCCKSLPIQSHSTLNRNLLIGLSAGTIILLFCGFLIWIYRRNLLPNIFKKSSYNQETMKVIEEYFPALIDEVQLNMGDLILVKAKFEDGWGFGVNITTESEGSFPLNCLGSIQQDFQKNSYIKDIETTSHSARMSSLRK